MRRTYSRASTDDQDATRARETLRIFASKHGTRIAATYVEKASGTLLDRRELLRLLADAERGDVLLVEAIDRLSRLDRATLRPCDPATSCATGSPRRACRWFPSIYH